jgi:hypothetical protein
MRSARFTTSQAAGRTLRKMKPVTSKRSCAAALASRRFSSLVMISSIQSFRVPVFAADRSTIGA